MNSRFQILILIVSTTTVLGCWFFVNRMGIISGADEVPVESVEKELIQPDEISPFSYQWSSDTVICNEGWEDYVNEIGAHNSRNEKLMIIGPYYREENNSTEYANLGLARAHELRNIFLRHIKEEKTQLSSRMIATEIEEAKKNPFSGLNYVRWVIHNEFIKQLDGKALVYFPSNSSDEISTPEILAYLDDLVKELLKEPELTIQIVGHTDSDGDSLENWFLGKDRAEKIAKLLTDKGIEESRVQIVSRGEEDPIANNDTESGKQKNRRTEVIINR